MHLPRSFLALFGLLAFFLTAATGLAGEPPVIKCPSPDGRFALRVADSTNEGETPTVQLVEKKSGKVILDWGTSYFGHREDIVLIWSADSKRVAYATRGPKDGEVRVFFWNGSAFDEGEMPETFPGPNINFGKEKNASVKNYGGAPRPVRWLKSGELSMTKESMMMSRDSGNSYTGVVTFTLSFDKAHKATVHNVGKTKTTVE